MKFVTQFTWAENGPDLEVNEEASMTEPDMTLTLQELLEKHTRGLEVPTYSGSYQDESDDFIPDPLSLDLADISAMQAANAAYIADLQSALASQEAEIKAAKQPKKESAEGDDSSPKQPATKEQKNEGEAS